MKLVLNRDYGGFSLSNTAVAWYCELAGIAVPTVDDEWPDSLWYRLDPQPKRTDPVLVKVVENMGNDAHGDHSHLEVVEVPTGAHYRIREYDGREWVELRDEIEWEIAQ
jgi:hypothetical protein